MKNSDHAKPEDNFLSRGICRLSSNVPIKKRPYILSPHRAPPSSGMRSSSIDGGSNVSENNADGSKQSSSSLGDMNHPASDTDLAIKDLTDYAALESIAPAPVFPTRPRTIMLRPRCRSITIPVEQGNIKSIMSVGQDKVLSCVTSAIHQASSGKFQSTIEELSKLPLDMGETSFTSPVQDETYELLPNHPLDENNHYKGMGIDAGKGTEIDAGLKFDYILLRVDRSNWDLNTSMDTWESSFDGTAMNLRADELVGSGQKALETSHFCMDDPHMHLRESNIYQLNDGRPSSSRGDQKLMLPDLSTTDQKCQSLASLDFQLKPSFTVGKKIHFDALLGESDSIKELPILSLSTEFTCTENGTSTPCAVIKPELPENCSENVKMKVESGLESANIKNLKSEIIAAVVGTETTPDYNKCSFNMNVNSESLNRSSVAKSSSVWQHSCPFKCCGIDVSQNVSECVSGGLIPGSPKPDIHQGSTGIVDKGPSLFPGSTISGSITSFECERISAWDSQDTRPMANEPPNDRGGKVLPLVPGFPLPDRVIACEKGEQISAPNDELKYTETMINEPRNVSECVSSDLISGSPKPNIRQGSIGIGEWQHSCPFKCCGIDVSQNVSECVSCDLISVSPKPYIHQDSIGIGDTISDSITSCECEKISAWDDAPQNTQPMANEPPNDRGGKVLPLVPGLLPDRVIASENGGQISGPDDELKYTQTMIDEPRNVVLRSPKQEGTDVCLSNDVDVDDSVSPNFISHVAADANECLNTDNVDVVPPVGSLHVQNLSSKAVDDVNLDSYINCEEADNSDMDISEGDLCSGYNGTISVVNSGKDGFSSSEVINVACDAEVCGEGNGPDIVTSFRALSSVPSNVIENDSNLEYAGKADEGHGTQAGSLPTLEDDFKMSNVSDAAEPLECGMLCDGSSRKHLVASHKITSNPQRKGKSPKTVRKSKKLIGTRSNNKVAEVFVQEKPEESPLSVRHAGQAKVQTLQSDDAADCVISKGEGTLSRACKIGPTFRMHYSPPRRMITSRTTKERVISKMQRPDGSLPHGSRDDTCNNRYISFHHDKYNDRASGEVSSDVVCARSRYDNKIAVVHGEHTFDVKHDQGKVTIGSQFSRSRDAPQVMNSKAVAGNTGNAGRYSRKPADDEVQTSPRVVLQGQPPRRRRHLINKPVLRHSVRDIIPSNCSRRNSPDFLPLSNDEPSIRNLPDKMMDSQLLSRPLMPYEQTEGGFFPRRRRSLSPIRRRRSPQHMPQLWSDSSPRSHMHVPPQWVSRRRPPDCFDELPEAKWCRSPPVARLDRMRSPRRWPEDGLLRRHGSPPYIDSTQNAIDLNPSRDTMVDIIPPSDNEFPRPIGGIKRTFQRFDMDSREIAEEACFMPLFRNHSRDIGEVECLDNRRDLDERRGAIRSKRQRFISPHTDRDDLRFGEEDGQSSPSRFFREPVGKFPDRISSRDYGRNIRTHVGRMACRPRGVEDQDNEHRHHGPEWYDASCNDMRPRRRF